MPEKRFVHLVSLFGKLAHNNALISKVRDLLGSDQIEEVGEVAHDLDFDEHGLYLEINIAAVETLGQATVLADRIYKLVSTNWKGEPELNKIQQVFKWHDFARAPGQMVLKLEA